MALNDEIEKELLPFLQSSARPDLKDIAIQQLLGLTGTDDGRNFIGQSPDLLSAIVQLVNDTNECVARNALLCITNLSSDDKVAAALIKQNECRDVMLRLLECTVNPGYRLADLACSVLSNVTRLSSSAHVLASDLLEKVGLDKIVGVLCKTRFNKDADLRYLSTYLMNMTQVSSVRRGLVAHPKCLLNELLPLLSWAKAAVERRGIAGVIKNCCFEYDAHKWLLSDEVDMLPHLLLPLAGTNDLDEEDMERLPPDVQYLPDTHIRDPDPEVRKMLVEALTKLCSTSLGRLFLKEKNVYVIMRELHKWESEEGNIQSVLNLIDILIGDEPEEGMEDLHKVEVPEHLQTNFDGEQPSANFTE